MRDGLPVRLVIGTSGDPGSVDAGESASDSPKTYHVREDLVGRVVEFDQDRFVIEFRKQKS